MDVIKVHAIARIMLNNWIPNIQASWVKEGSRMSQLLLTAGVNDLGGTLINESISTSAGAMHGQLMRPGEFRQLIREAGRTPAERYTTYGLRRVYSESDEVLDPLDLVGDNVEEIFGSYRQLGKNGLLSLRTSARPAGTGCQLKAGTAVGHCFSTGSC